MTRRKKSITEITSAAFVKAGSTPEDPVRELSPDDERFEPILIIEYCLCGHPKFDHSGGKRACRHCACGCNEYRRDASKKTPILPAGVSPERPESIKPAFESKADERAEQIAYFQWADVMIRTNRIPDLKFAYHVPNGEYRDHATSNRLKLMGVKPGVPDIEIPAARHGFTGAHIELKRTKTSRLEDSQEEFLEYLHAIGRFTFEAKGWDIARMVTEWYFHLGPWPLSGNQPVGPFKPRRSMAPEIDHILHEKEA